MIVFNTTPHSITFRTPGGRDIILESCGILNAAVVEEVVKTADCDVELVKTSFKETDDAEQFIEKLEAIGRKDHIGTAIIGSMIAAQAYPGRVYAMCPFSDEYLRVPPAEKRMSLTKFTVF